MDLISDLKMALAVARLNGISAAAREMDVTASSVSRRIDDLEKRLNVRIFNRTTKGLHVTDDGQSILAEGQGLVQNAEMLLSRATNHGDSLSGSLRVTAPARFGQLFVAPAVSRFMLEHPDVTVDLSCTDEIQNIEDLGMDIAIRIGRKGQQNNLVRKLAANHRVLVAAPAWIEQYGAPDTIDLLGQVDGLVLGTENIWHLKGPGGVLVDIKPNVRFRSRYGDVVRQICESGAGVAFKSLWDVSAAIEQGTLVQLFPEYQQSNPADITVVLPTRRYVASRVRVFIDTLDALMKEKLCNAS